MADKEKRLRKLLAKKGYKGQLKPVATFEEAHLICVEIRKCIHDAVFIEKDVYRQKIEEGYTFPEDQVHYLISTNPRNVRNIVRRFKSNSFGVAKLDLHS